MTVQVVRGGAAPDALYLIGYVFDRDYFDSQPNVRRWLADHGLVAAELRRRPFAFYVPVREIAPGQNAAMHLGVQGLHAAIQHLRKTGDLGHLFDRQALLCQQFGGAARGNQANVQGVQGTRQLNDARFV